MDTVAVAKVAVASAAYAIDKPYDYLIPDSLRDKVGLGVRVTVSFGRGNRSSEGIVLAITEESRSPKLKPISAVLDEEALLGPAQIRLAFWLRERYFCTLFDAVRVLLPAGLWYKLREEYSLTVPREEALELAENSRESRVLETVTANGGRAELSALKLACGDGVGPTLKALEERGILKKETVADRRVSDKLTTRVSLAVPPEEALGAVERKRKSAPQRYEVVKLLCAVGSALISDIRYFTGASMATIKSLEKSGLISMDPEEVLRVPHMGPASAGSICLSAEQQEAYDQIISMTEKDAPGCALLYGVTGSGKTAVYIRLLEEIVRRGRRGMLLVPEIALTPQMMTKFSGHFGDRVVMLHSGLSMGERYDQFKRIKRGEVDLVLGTRSAIFAPLENIGLIILDEEQEGSYQSENPPRYHARDVAKYLCAQNDAVLVLGSATPSVSSTYFAQHGIYEKAVLRTRYNQQPLPRVLIADMRDEVRMGNSGLLSSTLRRELAENLERGEQTILFLNRRGSSRLLLCGECGEVPECPRCSVPLTYHSANGRLMCHYCGHSERAPSLCPSCGGIMKQVGAGTQKVEEELHALFPEAEVLRMDADTVSGNHEQLLRRFETKNIPILLGTQMVAKGLDFENVTLVGVLAADLGLYVDSYRASERTFSLLTQVVGRAGRGSKDGRAVIQTFTPDNEVITAAAAQDYNSFYAGELPIRKSRRYPPFADIFTLTVSGPQEGAVLRAASELKAGLAQALPQGGEVELLGPAPAPILKVNDRYRYRLFWVGRNDHPTRELLAYYIRAFYQRKEDRGMSLVVDSNGEE